MFRDDPCQVIINPLKRVYLALESWFNLSFGTEWNPLYHLGTLSFFLFWIILVSGIYLFIPFHGSLEGAHASVEWMTHEQWYAGRRHAQPAPLCL